ncbi:unnamed protein product, partial [marine sediment metagenome]
AAAKQGFKAIPLGLRASVTLKNNLRQSKSNNVIALLPGSDRADECIIYMAHWDHFGIIKNLDFINQIPTRNNSNASPV